MLIRPYDGCDRARVAVLDADAEVDSVAELRLSRGRLTWHQSRLPVTRTKRHDLTGYLDEDPASWDDAFVAIDDECVIGFAASGLSEWNGRLMLRHMYVDVTARGQGVGSALLGAILATERAAGAQHIWLETQVDNVPAIRAYERMGFRIVGLDQTLYGDRPGSDTAVFMSQPLARQGAYACPEAR